MQIPDNIVTIAYGSAGAGTAANPFVAYQNVRNSNMSYGGLITSGPLAGQTFNSNGVLTAFTHGQTTGNASVEVGGDGTWYQGVGFIAKLQTDQAFGRASYELTDNVEAFVNVSGARAKTSNGFANLFNNYTLAADNPYLRHRQSRP